jgi:hypothetical protein
VFLWACSAHAFAQAPRAHVRFTLGSGDNATVHVISGTTATPLCEAPCEVELDAGPTDLGISIGEGAIQVPDHAHFDLREGSQLSVEHDDRNGLRIAGWVTFSALLSGFGVVVALGLASNASGCCAGYVLLIIPAPILGGLAVLVGLPLGLLNDHIDLREVGTARF